MSGVGGEGAHPDGAPSGMLQHRLDLSGGHRPHHRGGVRGAGGQELTAGAEATAVDAVAVARQGRVGQLGEVLGGGVHPQGLIPGAGGQVGGGQRAPVHVVSMALQGAY